MSRAAEGQGDGWEELEEGGVFAQLTMMMMMMIIMRAASSFGHKPCIPICEKQHAGWVSTAHQARMALSARGGGGGLNSELVH